MHKWLKETLKKIVKFSFLYLDRNKISYEAVIMTDLRNVNNLTFFLCNTVIKI